MSSANDTVIYVYYGNASVTGDQQNKTGVWDSNFKGVYHLPNGSTLSAADSTSNPDNGTPTGVTATSGKIDGAGSFSGSNGNGISITGVFGNPAQVTLEAWINLTSHGQYGGQVVNLGNVVQHVAYTINPSNSSEVLYLNGVAVATGSLSAAANYTDPNAITTIGKNPWYSGYYDFGGTIDEVRVSSTSRSSDWILTEYRNQNSPGTALSVGPQQ